jgi:hypothetical protein
MGIDSYVYLGYIEGANETKRPKKLFLSLRVFWGAPSRRPFQFTEVPFGSLWFTTRPTAAPVRL